MKSIFKKLQINLFHCRISLGLLWEHGSLYGWTSNNWIRFNGCCCCFLRALRWTCERQVAHNYWNFKHFTSCDVSKITQFENFDSYALINYSSAYIICAFISYVTYNWRTMQFVISTPTFFLLLLWPLVPESPRFVNNRKAHVH